MFDPKFTGGRQIGFNENHQKGHSSCTFGQNYLKSSEFVWVQLASPFGTRKRNKGNKNMLFDPENTLLDRHIGSNENYQTTYFT